MWTDYSAGKTRSDEMNKAVSFGEDQVGKRVSPFPTKLGRKWPAQEKALTHTLMWIEAGSWREEFPCFSLVLRNLNSKPERKGVMMFPGPVHPQPVPIKSDAERNFPTLLGHHDSRQP